MRDPDTLHQALHSANLYRNQGGKSHIILFIRRIIRIRLILAKIAERLNKFRRQTRSIKIYWKYNIKWKYY